MGVEAVRDLDGEFAKMARALSACDEAGLDYPEKLKAYFKKVSGTESLVEGIDYLQKEAEVVDFKYGRFSNELESACVDIKESHETGFEVDLSKLPGWVKKIRFVCSW